MEESISVEVYALEYIVGSTYDPLKVAMLTSISSGLLRGATQIEGGRSTLESPVQNIRMLRQKGQTLHC